jgi:hypothetical protein
MMIEKKTEGDFLDLFHFQNAASGSGEAILQMA